MKVSFDSDVDELEAVLSAVYAAFGVPDPRRAAAIDDEDDESETYSADDLHAMSVAELRALAKEWQVPLGTDPDKTALIAALLGTDYDAVPPPSQDDYFPGNWTRKRIRKLAQWVSGGDAEIALRYIAENAPSVGLDEVFSHMGRTLGIKNFNGQNMGGRMSSVGFAQNSIKGGVSNIYDTDYKHRKYRMDAGIAKVLLEELDAAAA